jgi:hypothetical protein
VTYELDPEGLADERPVLRDTLFRLQTLIVSAELSDDPLIVLDLDEARDLLVESVQLWRDEIALAHVSCKRRRT